MIAPDDDTATVLPPAPMFGPAVTIKAPGAQQAVGTTFCAWGTYSGGVQSITVNFYDPSDALVFTGAATFVAGYRFWYCTVTVGGSSSSSSSSGASGSSSSSGSSLSLPSGTSSSSSSSGSSGSSPLSSFKSSKGSIITHFAASAKPLTDGLGYRIEAVPNLGAGDQKTGIIVDPTVPPQVCSGFDSQQIKSGSASKTVAFSYTYPAPTDPCAPLYEVVVSALDYVDGQGNSATYHFPAQFNPNPFPVRNHHVPFLGKGIYSVQFIRIETFGPIVTSPILPKLDG